LYFKETKHENIRIDNTSSSLNNNRLINIDALTVDKNSRITLTKKVKQVFPLIPGDRVVLYQDRYNKNLIIDIQQQDKVVDRWTITRDNNVNNIRNSNTAGRDKTQLKPEYNPRPVSLGTNKDEDNFNSDVDLHSLPILLVDDEIDSLTLFKTILNSEGYHNVTSFSDPRKALRNFCSLKDPYYYRLAILDVRIPGINGIQMYNILKILNPSINVMFMTVLDAISELTSLFPEVKVTDILRKTVGIDEFIRAINYKVSCIIK
jgi:CheY-like chemotaxis protein/bifunctional DNA-binding transcriptional regulator/antitoxin component of YhaV-PrlF toxin-antitoxin module